MICFHAKRFRDSEAAFAESIAAWDASGSAPNADIARQLLLLGHACECQGKQRDALFAFQRSERAAVASLGPDHLLVALAVNNQGRALIAMKDHIAAEPLFERALARFESTEGQGSNTAIALNGLGMVRNAQKRHGEAIPLLERALRIFEKEHGSQFRDNADVWGNLAMSFACIGDERRANHARSRAEAILKGAK
jgi:tetratricopeptide (TPR) repeat protein